MSTTTITPLSFVNDPEYPVIYPTNAPAMLSDDARALYEGGSRQLDQDFFVTKRRNYVSPETAAAFSPTPRMVAAVDELVEANLARYQPGFHKTLNITKVDPNYVIAEGRGEYLAFIHAVHPTKNDSRLLAVLVGAEVSHHPNLFDNETLVIQTQHPSATDVEHDGSKTSTMTMQNPTSIRIHGGGRLALSATLVGACLYPAGTDILSVSDSEIDAGDVCVDCDQEHPFAPYLPPTADWVTPTLVNIELYPIQGFAVMTPPVPDQKEG